MINGIIIEGADQMGKTTFANQLAKALNMDVHHYGVPEKGVCFYNEYTKHIQKSIIFDRNYVSELVYGPLFRNVSGVTETIKKDIEFRYSINKFGLILLNRKNYKWIERDEEYTKEDNLLVINKFLEVYETIKLPKIIIDAFDKDAVEQALIWKNNN